MNLEYCINMYVKKYTKLKDICSDYEESFKQLLISQHQ